MIDIALDLLVVAIFFCGFVSGTIFAKDFEDAKRIFWEWRAKRRVG